MGIVDVGNEMIGNGSAVLIQLELSNSIEFVVATVFSK